MLRLIAYWDGISLDSSEAYSVHHGDMTQVEMNNDILESVKSAISNKTAAGDLRLKWGSNHKDRLQGVSLKQQLTVPVQTSAVYEAKEKKDRAERSAKQMLARDARLFTQHQSKHQFEHQSSKRYQPANHFKMGYR